MVYWGRELVTPAIMTVYIEDTIKKIVAHELQHYLDTVRVLPARVGIEHAATSAEGSTLHLLILLLLGAIVLLGAVIGIVAWIFLNRSAEKEKREREIEDARESRSIQREDQREAERIAEKRQDREDQRERDRLAREDRKWEAEERERREDKQAQIKLEEGRIYERQREAAREKLDRKLDDGLKGIGVAIGAIADDVRVLDKRLSVVEAVKKDKSSN